MPEYDSKWKDWYRETGPPVDRILIRLNRN